MSASDPAYPFQVALAAALLACSSITDRVADRVLDASNSQGASYPLIELGDDQIIPADHTAGSSSEINSNIHIWADGPDARLVAKQIAGDLRDLLTDPTALTIEGHVVVSAIALQVRHMLDGDPSEPGGLVAHSIAPFRFQTRPAP